MTSKSNGLIYRGVDCSENCGRRDSCYVCTVCTNAYFCNECVDDHWYATRHLLKQIPPSGQHLSWDCNQLPPQDLISMPKPSYPSSPIHTQSSYTYSVPSSDSDFEAPTSRNRPFDPFRTKDYAARLYNLPTSALLAEERHNTLAKIRANASILANTAIVPFSAVATGYLSLGLHAAAYVYKQGCAVHFERRARACREELTRRGVAREKASEGDKFRAIGKGVVGMIGMEVLARWS